MKLIFCDKYGFDEHKRKSRLSGLGLALGLNSGLSGGINEDPNDRSSAGENALIELTEKMQRYVIQPNIDDIITQFFKALRLDDEVNHVFSLGFRDDKLQDFLANYLVSLGAEFNQPQYFEQRLRMGIAHVNAGVSLIVFQIGYRLLQQLLLSLVPPEMKNAALLREFILKITTLDLIIATEVYQKYSGVPATENNTANAIEQQADKMSRGSVRQLLNDEQVSELLLTGLQQSASDKSTCLAVAKIDEIEKIEQVYGKDTVTQVRMGLTSRLLSTLRPGDGVGMIAEGGFIFVLSHTTLPIAEEICRRLMACVNQNPVSAEKMTIPVTISLVLMCVDSEVEPKIFIAHLENQLTQIQAKGVNQLELVNDVEENNGAVGG